MEEETYILEINLISAQGLKAPPANLRRMQTYVLAWADSSAKLRTGLDRIGGENPTWNDKFLFRISSDFVSSETSGVSFEIYSVACIKDVLLGTVRFVLSSRRDSVNESAGTPACIPVQIQRPSGSFHGVLNIGVSLYRATKSDRAMMKGVSAISFRDLMARKEALLRRRRRMSDAGPKRSQKSSTVLSRDLSSSSSSSNGNESNHNFAPTEKTGKKVLEAGGGGLLCGLLTQRRFSFCPLDHNMLRVADWAGSLDKIP
ncbi:hypothetical protein DM860_016713 [Cuscuta australis]|uniref:C2 domain-containing protein n=1 Tax=Cuscuta australis TaxID=267555 RepID=A0A328DLZ4_9ASTE|nr:hypothetical protein DM860_016713 [Cuscuta australis]